MFKSERNLPRFGLPAFSQTNPSRNFPAPRGVYRKMPRPHTHAQYDKIDVRKVTYGD